MVAAAVVIMVMRVVVFDGGNSDSCVLTERFVCAKLSSHVYDL